MTIDQDKHHKQDTLRQHATLNPRAHGVTHELFTSNEFFDPHDVLQVKYEMLRLVSIDKRSISEAARACGFSRPSFYQATAAFESDGLAGLLAHKSGPHGGHKRTPAVLQFIGEARAADPDIHAQRLAELVLQTFGVQVHPRSIERKLLRKKTALMPVSSVPLPRDESLVARYEDLRQQVLGRSAVQPQGLALFIRRGMCAWMQAWRQCVVPTPTPAPLQGNQQMCPAPLHRDVAMLLASMVLSNRQEAIT